MPDAFLLSRALLQFQSNDDDLLRQLSAVVRTPDGHLWVGSDEYLTVERLSPLGDGRYGDHKTFHLKEYLTLADDESEIDIEGLAYADGYLWVVGSHSLKRKKPKGKKTEKDIARLATIKRDNNRYLLARLPLCSGDIVASLPRGAATLTAASLPMTEDQHSLMAALQTDEHLGPFLQRGLPSKDNGFDIEGIAISGNRIFLGLRGPVLGGWAILLEVAVHPTATDGTLTLQPLDKEHGTVYRKHFLNLNGLGIRDLCCHGEDLLILAGPTMALFGPMQVFRLGNLPAHQDTLWHQDTDPLEALFDLPFMPGADNAEGLTLLPCLGFEAALMVVYDAPHPGRLVDKGIWADIFKLP
ncbi:MAG: DUF3616 domain-containing protein [Cyanobacteria bacterium P01_A01_bin.105]